MGRKGKLERFSETKRASGPNKESKGTGIWLWLPMYLGLAYLGVSLFFSDYFGSALLGAYGYPIFCFLLGSILIRITQAIGWEHAYRYILFFFILAPVLTIYSASQVVKHQQREQSRRGEIVAQLCETRASEKIHRAVEDVEGVFQLQARHSKYGGTFPQNNDMFDPWGWHAGDNTDLTNLLYVNARRPGYLYVEQHFSPDQIGPPFKRTYSHTAIKALNNGVTPDGYQLLNNGKYGVLETSRLRSRYGWITEDITTPEMREDWIAGGTIKVIELSTGEVLAEQTGFYRGNPESEKTPWRESGALSACRKYGNLTDFLFRVLQPKTKPIEHNGEKW